MKGPDKDPPPIFWRGAAGFHMTVDGASYDVPEMMRDHL